MKTALREIIADRERPFIGREAELTTLSELLQDAACRLVTIVGTGGVGKSWLALHVGEYLEYDFVDGVHFAALSSLRSLKFLYSTLADALDFALCGATSAREQLLNYLVDKEMLIILDTFEHLAEGAGQLERFLEHCPGLKFLVTSRIKLGLREEYPFYLSGLTYPEQPIPEPEAYPAVQLFTAHTRRVGAECKPEAYPAIVRICHLVEGLPLGIELAAAWATVLSCEEIAEEIEHSLDFLTTAERDLPLRHRSLRAIFDSSWKLLTPREQLALQSLTVFHGSFSETAAATIANIDRPTLQALTDKSLLERQAGGRRYQLPITLQHYVRDRLHADTLNSYRDRHSSYYTAFLSARENDILCRRQQETLNELTREIDNLRAAWLWALHREADEALEQALNPLQHYYGLRSRYQEANELFGQTLAQLIQRGPGAGVDFLIAQLQVRQGWFLLQLGHDAEAEAQLTAGYATLSRYGDPTELALAEHHLGYLAYSRGEYDIAQQRMRASLANYRAIQDPVGVVRVLNNLGSVMRTLGDTDQARELRQEALRISQAIGYASATAAILNNLGNLAMAEGDYVEARHMYEQHLEIESELHNQQGMAISYASLGNVEHYLGNLERARDLNQRSLRAYQESGHRWGVAYISFNLGHVFFDMGELGRALTLIEQGLELARAVNNGWGIAYGHLRLAHIYLEMGIFDDAEGYFCTALEMAREMHTLPLTTQIIVGLAQLRARQGDVETAVGLLQRILEDPDADQGVRDDALALMEQLTEELSPTTVATARSAHAHRSLAELGDVLFTRCRSAAANP